MHIPSSFFGLFRLLLRAPLNKSRDLVRAMLVRTEETGPDISPDQFG
jgi:hypothetical protein